MEISTKCPFNTYEQKCTKPFYFEEPIFVVPLHDMGKLPEFSQIFQKGLNASIKSNSALDFKKK